MSDTFDLLPDAVLRLDADQRIIEVNATTLALLGYQRGSLVGAKCAEILDLRSQDGTFLWQDGWHTSARLRSVRSLPEQDVTLRRADGSDLKAHAAGTYVRDGNGRLEGIVLAVREGGRRAHQQATGIEIVSTVSHELRSPLTSVKGYTSLLLNRWDRLKEDQKRMMLEQVNHDADRVTRLITELLDISRLETGRLVLRRQLVDVPALAATVLEKVKMDQEELDCTLEFDDGFPRLYADPDKVEQVLTNLVENACKYATPKGLRLIGTLAGASAEISVVDAGEGIPEEDLPRVFTKFFRRDLGRPTGSGLGLWISRGLVEAHGGRLWATSPPGEGTTFRFTLPLVDFDELFPEG